MKFEHGDKIRHKEHKDRICDVQEVSIIVDKEIGAWVQENNGARWVLQSGWMAHWEKVKK